MVERPEPTNSLGAALLREDTPDESAYEEYRMHLELALDRAKRLERITFHVCWISMLLAFGLSFVGGSRILGSFDPYDDAATPLSITLGALYVLACIAFPLSLASLYSRFRPRIRSIKQGITDAKIDQLQREVEGMRERLGE